MAQAPDRTCRKADAGKSRDTNKQHTGEQEEEKGEKAKWWVQRDLLALAQQRAHRVTGTAAHTGGVRTTATTTNRSQPCPPRTMALLVVVVDVAMVDTPWTPHNAVSLQMSTSMRMKTRMAAAPCLSQVATVAGYPRANWRCAGRFSRWPRQLAVLVLVLHLALAWGLHLVLPLGLQRVVVGAGEACLLLPLRLRARWVSWATTRGVPPCRRLLLRRMQAARDWVPRSRLTRALARLRSALMLVMSRRFSRQHRILTSVLSRLLRQEQHNRQSGWERTPRALAKAFPPIAKGEGSRPVYTCL